MSISPVQKPLLIATTRDLPNGRQLAHRLQPDQFGGELRDPAICDPSLHAGRQVADRLLESATRRDRDAGVKTEWRMEPMQLDRQSKGVLRSGMDDKGTHQ